MSVDRFRVVQIDHVEVFVPDRHEAATWYRRVLGCEILQEYAEWSEDPRGPLMISPDGGRTKLALFRGEPQGASPTAGFHLVAFRVTGRRGSREGGFRVLQRPLWAPLGSDELRG